jgi:hypothetical protein
MTYPRHENQAPSEDDLRDLESRNIRDGWPYSDTPGAASPSPENRPYGSTAGNFDRDHNDGYRIVGVDGTGEEASLKDRLLPETTGREESDEIESKISERFEAASDAALNNVEIYVDGHTATLTGMVDTAAERRMATRLALSVPHVHHVINEIETIGVDSHEPEDD